MKHRPVVELVVHVPDEVRRRDRGLRLVELDLDLAHRRLHHDHGIPPSAATTLAALSPTSNTAPRIARIICTSRWDIGRSYQPASAPPSRRRMSALSRWENCYRPSMSEFSPVVPVDAVAPGKTAKFVLTRDGRELEAFVLNHDGRLVAYVNRCCHIPMTMDWVENQVPQRRRDAHPLRHPRRALRADSGECVSVRRSASASPPCRSRCATARSGPPGRRDRNSPQRNTEVHRASVVNALLQPSPSRFPCPARSRALSMISGWTGSVLPMPKRNTPGRKSRRKRAVISIGCRRGIVTS